jgi:hypothetical protein
MISEVTAKALRLIKDQNIISAKQFAGFMWPDSDGWTTHTNCGHGVTHGGGMNLAGGAYLGRLKKRGLVTGYGNLKSRYYLTPQGEKELSDFEAQESSARNGEPNVTNRLSYQS